MRWTCAWWLQASHTERKSVHLLQYKKSIICFGTSPLPALGPVTPKWKHNTTMY
jgi:hypothetical protein